MLFSGGGTKGTPPKEQRKERKPDKDEKYEIQEAVFVRWAGSTIDDEGSVQELKDLTGVAFLSKFSTLILGVPVAISGKSETDDIDAIFHAMVPDDPEDKLFQISVNELLSSQQKPLLAMCWQLIQIYWSKFAPPPSNERKLTEALKEWCLEATTSHSDVVINDFTSSFRDGMAINILIKSFDESLVDLHEISELRGEERIECALSLARRHFRVPKLIQPKEFSSEHLDMKSVACYLMMLYLGMCETTSRQQKDPPSSRRRSTLVQQQSVPSGIPRKVSSLDQQATRQSPTMARKSSVQVAAAPVPLPPSVHPAKMQTPPRIITEQVSTPPLPTSTTATPPKSVQAQMLNPPPAPQSPKAHAHIPGTPHLPSAAGISPLAQQSHSSQAQQPLLQHQQQQPHIHVQMGQPMDPMALQLGQQQVQPVYPPLQAVPPAAPTYQSVVQAVKPVQAVQQQQPIQAVQPTTQIVQLPSAVVQQPGYQFPPQAQQPIQMMQTAAHQQPIQQQPAAVPVIQPAQPQQLPIQPVPLPPMPSVQPAQQPLPPMQPALPQQHQPFFSFPSPPPYEQHAAPVQLPSHPAQHPANDGSAEGMRSRKSSSSSQRSRSRMRRPEEMLQEYQSYLQQVLNWLNDAEHELDVMKSTAKGAEQTEGQGLEEAKEEFREHEQYMQSLTQSQENVGRVLRRGHQLSQRLEGEQASAIAAQLEVVSARWERIREMAMQRQTALQNQIELIQRRHLSSIMAWLDKIELKQKAVEVLGESAQLCQQQLGAVKELRQKMEEKQPAVQTLSTFVAVVEQPPAQIEPSYASSAQQKDGAEPELAQLESLVKQVSKRWDRLGEWVEQRTKLLEGMSDLLENYESAVAELSSWLGSRFDELQKLHSAHHLETGEQVQEQLDMLREMERALESQQEAFVRLSQICTELAAKFEKAKSAAGADKVRASLDLVTQKWDQIVTRLEEHSDVLIRSGKVKLATDETKREPQQQQVAPQRKGVLETIMSVDEGLTADASQQEQARKRKQLQQSMRQYLVEEEASEEPTPKRELKFAEALSSTSDDRETVKAMQVGEEREKHVPVSPTATGSLSPTSSTAASSLSPSAQESQQIVANFVEKVTAVDRRIQPLVDWAGTVVMPQRTEVRKMVLVCQKKLNEIKELEPTVTKLQIQLEHIHNRANLSAKQLHIVNEIFHIFMARWSRLVGTISQMLVSLSKPEPLTKQSLEKPQSRVDKMVDQVSKWLKASANYLDELPSQMPTVEKLKKIAQIARQLSEQQAQLSHVKRVAKFTSEEEKQITDLELEMVELLGRIDQMRRNAEQRDTEKQQHLLRATTSVQMKKGSTESSSSPERRHSSPQLSRAEQKSPSSSVDVSPPPLNEAESLRLKLLAEEAELARRESAHQGEVEEGAEEEGWNEWLKSKQNQLRLTDECVPGDLKRLSAELEKCDTMIAELRTKLREASASESDAEMAAPIEHLLKAAETKRNHCVDSINKTQLAIHKSVKAEELGDKFKRELDWLRRNSAETPLRDIEARLKHLQDSLGTQLSAKVEAVQLLEEVAQMAASGQSPGGELVGEQMRQRTARLGEQWASIGSEIEELLLCCGIERQKRADGWLKSKKSMLAELEQALKASFESATDAEELSEHLDNLERLLDLLNSLDEESADEGHSALLMTQSGEHLDTLRTKTEHLAKAAHDRCGQLRNAVTRCEHFEQRLCKMQQWCTNMHQILNQRLASDTFALEVPHEYKDAQKQGTLFRQMDKEFADFDELVHELEQYIQQSKSEFASTERLKLQLDHANEQLGQLRAKFGEFKQPITLHERMERIQRQLAETESNMDDLAQIQAENCEFCLLHARQLQRQLEEVSIECAACEVGRDTLIREGILEEAQALQINARLTELNAKFAEQLEPRAVATVRRLERAVELLEKLEREKAVMEKLLGEAEHRVEDAEQVQLLSATALDELSRQLKVAADAAGKARELEQLLRQLSIRLPAETLNAIAEAEKKSVLLREQEGKWLARREAEQRPQDDQSAFAELDALAASLGESMATMERPLAEGAVNATQLNGQLGAIRPAKEQYERRALDCLGRSAEHRRRVAPTLASLTARWQTLVQAAAELEQQDERSQPEMASTAAVERGAAPSPVLVEQRGVDSDFGESIRDMILAFERAERHLNFQSYPIKSIQEWQKRLADTNQFVANRKLRFDELIAEGKRVAESGPMELETSANLAKLDELIELVHLVDEQIERLEDRLFNTKAQLARVGEQVELTRERIASLGERTAQLECRRGALDPTPIITLQQELMDTSGQLQLLHLSADELRNTFPPTMHEERIGGDVLDELNRQLHSIESRVQSALLRALHAQQEEEGARTAEPREEAAATTSTDQMSSGEDGRRVPSAEGEGEGTVPVLAMDAYGTEDEQQRQRARSGGEEEAELLQSTVSTLLPPKRAMLGTGGDLLQPKLDEMAGMDQFYVNLDTMEEFLEQPELLPFEGFDEKAEVLKDFETELERGEKLVMTRQMTMEVGESEHIVARIAALRGQLNARKAELEKRRDGVHTLEQLYARCEQMLDELAQNCKSPRQSPKRAKAESLPSPRNGSPDLDELEKAQTLLENQLPPIAVRLQQTQNRVNAIAERLSTAVRDRYQQRIQVLVDDFNECTKAVRAKRRALDERCADQTRLSGHLEELEFWCDETETIVDADGPLGALNVPRLEEHIGKVRKRHASADAKMDAFRTLERLKDKFVALSTVEPQAKHEVRRNVAQLGKRISDLRMRLRVLLDSLAEEKMSAEELWREFGAMEQWVQGAERQIAAVESAKIFKPSLVNIEKLAGHIGENRLALESIRRRLAEECAALKGEEGLTEGENLQRVERQIEAFESVAEKIDRFLEQRAVASDESSSMEEEIENLYTQMDATRKRLVKQAKQKLAEEERAPMRSGWENGHRGPEQDQYIECGTLSSVDAAEQRLPIPPEGLLLSGEEEQGRQQPRRKMSLGEQTRLDTVTRLRSWLQEVERDVSTTVDLSDQHIVRQQLGKMQNCVDDIQIRHLEVVRVLDEARDRLIAERAQLCATEMDRVLGVCKRRKAELQTILEQCRMWDQLRASIELWLGDANDRLSAGGRVVELHDDELVEQLELCGQLSGELDAPWKGKLQELNRVSNQLLDVHRRDNGHNLSHLSSKLNTQWAKFNDSLRIRRAVLEAAQRSRHDFQTALGHFQQWLNGINWELQQLEKETNNPQRLKDTSRRKNWLAQEKEARMEIDAHREIMESVKKMGRKLMEEQQQELSSSAGEESSPPSRAGGAKSGDQLRKRVEAVEGEWHGLLELSRAVQHRLESAQEECERLTQSLADFLFWTDQQLKTIADSKPLGGDLAAVQRQSEIARNIERTMEARERQVEETVRLANTFLMQHDLRPPIHTPSLLAEAAAEAYVAKTEAEREERRLGMQILADSARLQSQWALLKEHLSAWTEQVANALHEMQELDRAMAEALLALGAVEEELNELRPVEDLLLEELKVARAECSEFRHRVHEAGTSVDDVNDWASNLQAAGIQLSEQLDAQVQAVNARYEKLKREIGCRGAALERAFNDFGPASEHFLVDLVEPPWQRAVSTVNRLPYYVDHSSEQTQWDHPAMVDILEQLCSFNQVKFSAYRTAMKLRALQKRLCLDLIDLADLDTQYGKHLANYTDEQRIHVEDVVQCLLPLFEKAQEERPALLSNVSLAVDLTLNLLLNIYDPCRDGKMRVLSFKVALVVLCHASLESKYTYLFHLISNQDGVDHKRLAVLFYDLIHIPKFLGEAAAFGGSNIEPSVRSCFEHAKFPPTISVEQFLEWLKKEPQSLVWLPVMHRLASSEFAKHQAKCNACKMFPIVGLRYRCLRCFNFDICQNCFFSQRTAKSHKLSHPMQEYCTPTSAGDDVRDFTVIIKNKVRQGKHRIGYLPVEQINEGAPLECADQTPQNADTEAMHQRIHLIASRLDKRHTEAAEAFPNAIMPSEGRINDQLGRRVSIRNGDDAAEARLSRPRQFPLAEALHERQRSNQLAQSEVKSPTQLLTQADQAGKEEMNQLIQKLQFDNLKIKHAVEEKRAKRAGMPFQSTAKSTPNLYQQQRTPLMGQAGRFRQTSEVPADGQGGAMPAVARERSELPVLRSPSSALPPQLQQTLPPPIARHPGHSMPSSLHRQTSLGSPSTAFPSATFSPEGRDQWQEMAVLAEANHLRIHQKRLEERGMVLEDQNRQLQMQLDRLQKLMEKRGDSFHPHSRGGHQPSAGFISSTDAEDTDMEMLGLAVPVRDIKASGLSAGQLGTEIRRNRMDRLRETVNELNQAMENFVIFTQNCASNGVAKGAEHQDTDDSGTADQDHQVTDDQ